MRFLNIRILNLLPILVCLVTSNSTQAQSDWTQWGGPDRNFQVKSKGLAAKWPSTGPKQLWTRPLGDGHSAVLVDGNTLYTMYSQAEQEVVIALAADTGKTIWEHKYAAPTAGLNYEYGHGPHSTPVLAGDMLFTVGSVGHLNALNKRTGKVAWSKDLWNGLGGTKMDRGYSCSPLIYKDKLILTLGGQNQALAAFNIKDGSIAWKALTLDVSPSSHLVINVDGQDQLVAFMGKQIVGVDPNNGSQLWSHGHVTEWGLNITMPIWGNDNLLFVSSAYSGGSRVLKLTQKEGKTNVEELWFHRRLRIHHGTAVRIGDYVYGSSGDFGPAFFAGVNVKTGEIAFQDRSFPKTNFVYADGKLIILDEDGNLALATINPGGLGVISKVPLMKNVAWTVPTLAGTKLYLRDRRTITAVDLS